MRLRRTLTPVVFTLCLLVWPALVQADFQTGMDAYNQGDYATAFKEWQPLAEQGEADAQVNLGLLYDFGKGVPQDYGQARDWYLKAAEQGHALAQANLGVMYWMMGPGVLQDYVQAHMWANLAAAQSQEQAPTLRDILAKKMTPAQIADAQELAREWMAQHQK